MLGDQKLKLVLNFFELSVFLQREVTQIQVLRYVKLQYLGQNWTQKKLTHSV